MCTLLESLSNFCRVSDIVRSSCKDFKGSPASWPSLFTLFAALKLAHFNHICAYCLTCCCYCCCCCCFCIWLGAGQLAKLRSYLSLWRSVWLIQVWLFRVHTAELLWPACYSWLNTHTHTHTSHYRDTYSCTALWTQSQLPSKQFSKLARTQKKALADWVAKGGDVGVDRGLEHGCGRGLVDCCALSCAKHSLNIFCNSSAAHMRDKRRTYHSQQQRDVWMWLRQRWGKVEGGRGLDERVRSDAEVWALQWNFLHLNIFQKLFTVDFSPDAFHTAACAYVCVFLYVCVCMCSHVCLCVYASA